jgi:hypothetical protein
MDMDMDMDMDIIQKMIAICDDVGVQATEERDPPLRREEEWRPAPLLCRRLGVRGLVRVVHSSS